MFIRRKQKQMAAQVDGEKRYASPNEAPQKTPELQAYQEELIRLREGVHETIKHTPEISDGQFGSFMAGIHEGIEKPAPRHVKTIWATASLTTAALVVVVSLWVIFSSPNDPVQATEVESAHTELDGAAVNCYDTPQGMTTVWVTMPENDLW
ncbi:MAG: hypothetical protein KAH38_10690 [Candidatus Hydrogenedentes bacterium]|nr:hypothetical protein [Candidatus Hydrogenedentota bacterium]